MKVLLISATGTPPFAHAKQVMREFLGPQKTLGFVSAASLFDEADYFHLIRTHLTEIASPVVREMVHLRWDADRIDALNRIDALLVGGGNTYALLKRLAGSGLLGAIRQKVQEGLPYIGSSAGANLAGPNILTTNDWNVVSATSFDALGLVPFNINPHYVERGFGDGAHSETRTLRIREYHQVHANPVVAIEETAILRIENRSTRVLGEGGAKVFARGGSERWYRAGEELVFDHAALLSASK